MTCELCLVFITITCTYLCKQTKVQQVDEDDENFFIHKSIPIYRLLIL